MLTSVDSREAHEQDRPERPVAGGVAQHAAGAVPRRDAKVPVGLLTTVFSAALVGIGVDGAWSWGRFMFGGYPGFRWCCIHYDAMMMAATLITVFYTQ